MELTEDYREYLLEKLQKPRQMAAYLDASLELGDRAALLLALRNVADAVGVAKLANWANLNRVNLYRMLSDTGNPRLDSLESLLDALGLRLAIAPKKTSVHTAPKNAKKVVSKHSPAR